MQYTIDDHNITCYSAVESVSEQYKNEEDSIDFVNNIFIKLYTDWGIFYVCNEQYSVSRNIHGGESLIYYNLGEYADRKAVTAILLYQLFDYVPLAVYQEAIDDLEDVRARSTKIFNELYAGYEKLTDEEIREDLIKHFTDRLENYFKEGYEIIDISYFDDDQYEVVGTNEKYDSMERIAVKIKDKKGVIEKGIFTVFTRGNQLWIADYDNGGTGIRKLYESIEYLNFNSKE